MVTQCSVCSSPSLRPLVDALLQSGRSQMSVAKTVGVGRMVIVRHVGNGHVPPVVQSPPQSGSGALSATKAPSAGSSPAAGSSLSAEDLLKSVIADLDIDLKTVSASQRMAILEMRRRAASDLARIGTPAASVDDGRPTWDELREILALFHQAAAPYPEARYAFSQLARRVLGKASGQAWTEPPPVDMSVINGGVRP